MPLSATAEGSASAGTCSLTDACQAGPNKAIPLPTMKQETSRRAGVITPSHARTESEIEPANAIDRATSPTIRRSNISAIAPAGVDTTVRFPLVDVQRDIFAQDGRRLTCSGGTAVIDKL